MMRTVAIVQARMGSTRLPGKMLENLGGLPVLGWVLRRVMRSRLVDEVILATSDSPKDDPIAEMVGKYGIRVFRGSESDVLERFIGASTLADAGLVVRVCADNPFIDPAEIDRLIAHYLSSGADYCCNHQDRLGSGYADGFGAEIISLVRLSAIAEKAKLPRHREHVTLYVWDHPEQYAISVVPAPVELAHPQLRFDVDQPEDLDYLRSLCSRGVTIDSTAGEIVSVAAPS